MYAHGIRLLGIREYFLHRLNRLLLVWTASSFANLRTTDFDQVPIKPFDDWTRHDSPCWCMHDYFLAEWISGDPSYKYVCAGTIAMQGTCVCNCCTIVRSSVLCTTEVRTIVQQFHTQFPCMATFPAHTYTKGTRLFIQRESNHACTNMESRVVFNHQTVWSLHTWSKSVVLKLGSEVAVHTSSNVFNLCKKYSRFPCNRIPWASPHFQTLKSSHMPICCLSAEG